MGTAWYGKKAAAQGRIRRRAKPLGHVGRRSHSESHGEEAEVLPLS